METLEQLLERHVDEMQGVVGEYIDVTAKRHHDESVAWFCSNEVLDAREMQKKRLLDQRSKS